MANGYVHCGEKKLGLEFAYAMFSYFFVTISTYNMTLNKGSLEAFIFYILSIYEIVIYFNVAMSDPGRVDEKMKKQINIVVSPCYTVLTSITVQENGRAAGAVEREAR